MTYHVRPLLLCGTASRVLWSAFVTRPFGPVFNRAAVRDALGLVRLLWPVERDHDFSPDEDDLDAHLKRMNLLTEALDKIAELIDAARRCLGPTLWPKPNADS